MFRRDFKKDYLKMVKANSFSFLLPSFAPLKCFCNGKEYFVRLKYHTLKTSTVAHLSFLITAKVKPGRSHLAKNGVFMIVSYTC